MARTVPAGKQRPERRRRHVDEQLQQLVDAGAVTLDEQLRIAAAAAAAGVRLGPRPAPRDRPGT